MAAIMHRFHVLAASETDARVRIEKVLHAWSEFHALRLANDELRRCAVGYYVVDIRELR